MSNREPRLCSRAFKSPFRVHHWNNVGSDLIRSESIIILPLIYQGRLASLVAATTGHKLFGKKPTFQLGLLTNTRSCLTRQTLHTSGGPDWRYESSLSQSASGWRAVISRVGKHNKVYVTASVFPLDPIVTGLCCVWWNRMECFVRPEQPGAARFLSERGWAVCARPQRTQENKEWFVR